MQASSSFSQHIRSLTPPGVRCSRPALPPQAPRDQVERGCSGAPEAPGMNWKLAGMLLMSSAAGLLGSAGPSLAEPAPQQQSAPAVPSGVRYDHTAQEVVQLTKNSLTAAELPAGAPRFTARGVDPNQSSKRYHDPKTLEVDGNHAGTTANIGGVFRQCTRFSPDGACQSALPNQLRYSVLSCLYQNEADGKLYRVTQQFVQDNYMPMMDRNVCAGHRLAFNPEDMSYRPQQTNAQGETLYVNPAHILKVEPAETPGTKGDGRRE